VASLLFLALSLSIIPSTKGTIYTDSMCAALLGVILFGVLGLIHIWIAKGIWKFEKSTIGFAYFLAIMGLIIGILNTLYNFFGIGMQIAFSLWHLEIFPFNILLPLAVIFLIRRYERKTKN